METKILIVAFPTMESVVEKISSAIDDAFNFKPKKAEPKKEKVCEDFTPKRFKVKDAFGRTPKDAWGIGGTPANENLRFGYQGPCIDEPRRSDYDDREDFEYDHALFDEYVSAAEDCIARGLEKKSDAPIYRCNAIRKPIGCPPPMNLNLIGETQWFDEDVDWEF